MAAGTVELTTEPADALPPGPYRVEALIEAEDDTISDLTATDEHTLLRNGKPFVATGTSYMATDVHRRFLLEPNPIVWDGDFAAMRRAGINMIRTDIWTGWKKYMPEVGAANEAALWALDAFFLAATRRDIPVIFTFRAFLPEMWSGNKPLPRSARGRSAEDLPGPHCAALLRDGRSNLGSHQRAVVLFTLPAVVNAAQLRRARGARLARTAA